MQLIDDQFNIVPTHTASDDSTVVLPFLLLQLMVQLNEPKMKSIENNIENDRIRCTEKLN